MTKNKKAEEIAFSRCDVPERTKRFALQYVSEAYAGIKNCRECEFYNTCDRIDSVRAELRKKKKEGMKNMTEQETREKIFNIIREFNVKKRRYSTHTEPSDDDELADALIAAGLNFGTIVSHTATFDLTQQEQINRLEREVAELKEKDINCVNSVDEMIKMCDGCGLFECCGCEHSYAAVQGVKELKRRALLAEHALKVAADLGELCAPIEDYIKQAECELSEEKK